MHKSIILKKSTKNHFTNLVKELMGKEYEIITHDKENFQLETIVEGKPYTYHLNWSELAISEIPQRLGISILVLPIGDDDFNLAEYLVKHYEDKVNAPKESVISKYPILERKQN